MTPLQARLATLRIMQKEEIAILGRLQSRISEYPAGCIVQHERGQIETTRIIISGWAIRYCTTFGGDRQIVNFLLPGDTIGLYGALFDRSESGVELITDAVLAEFPCAELMDTFRESARLGAALCWLGGQDERFLEQQILRIGALNSTERIAHLLVELQQRLLTSGARPADATAMPITQKLIAEALGISHVHANRCCRRLEKSGLIETGQDGLTLLDPAGLKSICGIDGDESHPAGIPDAAVRRLDNGRA
jgi:CRP-like cAMP-binding protein